MRTQYNHTCTYCHKPFQTRAPKQQYCSTACANRGRPRQSDEERFWSHVDKSGDCWLWTSATNGFGYGKFTVGGRQGKQWIAPRFSYTLAYGPIPDGLGVCHRCDTPACVNPAHLFLGTQADNLQDMVRKGRHWVQNTPGALVGERNFRAILTEAQVREMRALWAAGSIRQIELAHRFSVSKGVVWRVVHGKHWRHLDNPLTEQGNQN